MKPSLRTAWTSGTHPRGFPRRIRITGLPFLAPENAGARIVADLDGGGLADLILHEGSFTPAGGLHVLRGEDLRGMRDVAWANVPKRTIGSRFQQILDFCALDWNGDGLADLAVGAAVVRFEGVLLLYGGDTFLPSVSPVTVDDAFLERGRRGLAIAGLPGVRANSFGHSLANASDPDGDGKDDLLIGHPFGGAALESG